MAAVVDHARVCQLCRQGPLEPFVVPRITTLWRCPQCGLYQYGALVGTSTYEDQEYHAGYDRHARRKLRTATVRLSRIAAVVNVERPRLLDVGCGLGFVLEAAVARGWDASGVDVSGRVVEICRQKGLDSHVVTDDRLPFDDQSFDIVTAWSVIEHMGDVREALDEWRRVLRPGGLLVVDTSDADCLKVRLLGARYRRFWRPEHTYAFTPRTLVQLLEKAGYQLIPQPLLGRLRGLSAPMACYAVAYQTQFELRRVLRIQKPFQLFARRAAA
jgi:ubiquinone/menaquinone biosynthesis C-methylase UbiE